MSEHLDFEQMVDAMNRAANDNAALFEAMAPHLCHILACDGLDFQEMALIPLDRDGWYQFRVNIKASSGIGVVD